MKKLYCFKLLIIILLISAIYGCNIFGIPDAEFEDSIIDYYSKYVEFSKYVDSGENFLMPVETFVYDQNGKIAAKFKYEYEPIDTDPDYWVNTKTKVYSIDEQGTETFKEYYIYVYDQIYTYTGYDENDNEITITEHLLTHSETYNSKDAKKHYSDTVYDGADTDKRLSIKDWELDDSEVFVETNRLEYTYYNVNPPGTTGRTLKSYSLMPDDTELSLSYETATWYDDEGRELYDLYHTIRSSDTDTENLYYYRVYSWDDNNRIYMRSDYIYDSTNITFLLDGSFDADPFAYDIEHDHIAQKVSLVLSIEHDNLGNIISETKNSGGEIQEYVTYSYNQNSEQTDMSRYINKGTLLYDRITTRYRDEYKEDVYYRVKEECTYMYYDTEQ